MEIALIGLGKHTRENLLPAVHLAGLKVTFLCSRNQELCNHYAERFSIPNPISAWEDLRLDDVDAVVVAATPEVHEKIIKACVAKNVPVFVEKPPARNIDHLRGLSEAAGCDEDVLVFVDFNFRFSVGFQEFRGKLGSDRVAFAAIRFISSKPRSLWLGYSDVVESMLYGVSIHAIDLALSLCDVNQVVSATCFAFSETLVAVSVVLKGERGQVVTLELGNYSNRFEHSVRAVTVTGRTVSLFDGVQLEHFEGSNTTKSRQIWEVPTSLGGFGRAGYDGAIQAFVATSCLGKTSASGLSNSLRVYKIIAQILEHIR